jgi:hypothetical protein
VGAAAVAGRPGPAATAGPGVSGWVWIGSDLAGLQHAGSGVLDLGEFVCSDLVSVRPTVVALTRIGSTDFGALSQQQRADALVVIEQHRAWLDGLQPTISVIVSLETLAGVEDEPGWLDGYGPITAQAARALAADQTGTWRRLVIDPIFGQVIDYGTTRYRPPTHLAELVIARDGTCVFPPCNRPARSCDLDHHRPFPDGDTSAENLGPGCRRDHRLKHQAGWQVRRNPDGTTTWTSPHGREYTNHPPARWKVPGE